MIFSLLLSRTFLIGTLNLRVLRNKLFSAILEKWENFQVTIDPSHANETFKKLYKKKKNSSKL